jgi:hypothetical protein
MGPYDDDDDDDGDDDDVYMYQLPINRKAALTGI